MSTSTPTSGGSSKKKKDTPKRRSDLWITCPECQCLFIGKDLERHRQFCTIASSSLDMDSATAHSLIVPTDPPTLHCEATLSECTSLASFQGWNHDHLVSLNPATMEHLGLTVEAHCTIASLTAAVSVGSVTDDVSVPLGTIIISQSLGKFVNGQRVSVTKLADASLSRCESISLGERTGTRKLGGAEVLCNFLEDYFYSGAVLCSNGITSVWYINNVLYEFVVKSWRTVDGTVVVNPANVTSEADRLTRDIANISISSQVTHQCSFLKLDDSTEIKLASGLANGEPVPTRSFDDIGGLEHTKEELRVHLLRPLLAANSRATTLLLHGGSGCGKTILLEACHSTITSEKQPFALRLSCNRVLSKFYSESEERLKSALASVNERQPSCLILDDLDVFFSTQGDSAVSEATIKLTALLSETLDALGARVWLLAACRSPDRMDASLRRRFICEITVGSPGETDRRQIIESFAEKLSWSERNKVAVELAKRTHGYTGSDLNALCLCLTNYANSSRAKDNRAVIDETTTVDDSAVDAALKKVRPTALREISLEVPHVRWSDVGGQTALKIQLQQAVDWPIRHADSFSRLGVAPPSGLLLYGPPGCSKTLIARALATETQLNFLAVKGPELFSKWVGESERAIRELFARARQAAPCVVFFDEIDAVGASRSGASSASPVADRVLAQLLTEMDGLEGLKGIVVIAATNRPDRIDSALLRPGRLDRSIYVPLPDRATREEILAIQLRTIPVEKDVSIPAILDATDGYSGAEVAAVCREAAYAAMREAPTEVTVVAGRHFDSALTTVYPRCDQKLLNIYREFAADVP